MSRRRWLNRGSQLDAQLRNSRPQARDEFVKSLSEHVVGRARTPIWARSRLAFAGAVSTFILGTLVSFGGLSYAASGAAGTYHTVKQVAVHHTLFVSVHKSSASDQYAPPPKPHPKKHHRTSGAVGVAGVMRGEHIGSALLVLVIWVVFLNGGTLAINSVFDKDEGDIGYLNSPPALPPARSCLLLRATRGSSMS